jgi:hypothetical protein
MDQLVLDELPDDPRHLVAVHFDDGVGDFDFGHSDNHHARAEIGDDRRVDEMIDLDRSKPSAGAAAIYSIASRAVKARWIANDAVSGGGDASRG